jgi:ABC-type dipeptide/oligopeptide/nickel transport system permease component
MICFLLTRLALAIPTLLAISFLTFMAAALAPGDPVDTILGERAAPEIKAQMRRELGLDKPPLVRYGNYITGVVTRGDLGISYVTREPVNQRIARGFRNTAFLASCALFLSLVIGIPLGIAAAVNANKPFDRIAMGTALAGVAVPSFVLGPVLVLLLAVQMRWLPVIGFEIPPSMPMPEFLTKFLFVPKALPLRAQPQFVLLPAFVLAARSMALIARLTRSAMLEVLGQDYIRTARAKGLSNGTILFKHALKNAFPPILTVAGTTFGYLLSGSFVVETFFTIPGIGNESIRSILNRDYMVIQAMALLLAAIFVGINILVDILYGFLDPRARVMGKQIAASVGIGAPPAPKAEVKA